MSVLLAGSQVRALLLGVRVDRATATLPQTAQGALFTVTGGRVIVTGLVGEVTTAVQAQATTVQIVGNPTTGTDVNWTNTTGDINGKEVGSLVTLPATLGGTASVQTAGGNVLALGSGFVAAVGTIDLKTGASSTGSAKWSITYIPLDDGASVAAA